jgi:NtrC-family two-component system sensor histidine kinase KinB
MEMLEYNRLETLYVVNEMLKKVEADGLHLDRILPRVLNLSVRQLEAYDGSIIVVNEALEIEHAWLSEGSDGEERGENFLSNVMNMGVAGWVIRNQYPLVIADTQTDPRWLPRPDHPTSTTPWSVICTPFIIRDRAIGALTIHKPGRDQFNDHDLQLMTTISNQAASSIENARLYAASQRQLLISDLLNQASQVINSSLDIDEIMQSLLTQMNEFMHAEAISIALVDEQTNELVWQVAEGVGAKEIIGLRMPANVGLSGWVMQHGEPALVRDTRLDDRFSQKADLRTGTKTRAMICAPMQFKSEALGTIQAINPVEGSFTDEDLDLLVKLATIASSAIANAQQFARAQAAEARYLNLFQDTIDPILITDMERCIVEANENAVQMLGYGRAELKSLAIDDLHPPSTDIPAQKAIAADQVVVFRSELIGKHGTRTPVDVYAKRTIFRDTELLQWIHHDISEQVELDKMRDDLTAMLFHDLQSPLGNVISSLELLAYEIPPASPDSPLFMMLDIAKRSSRRLQTLIRSLLDINRLEAGHPISEQTEVDLAELLDELAEIEKPNLEQRRVKLGFHIPTPPPTLYVEEDMIRRVLINLVSNALKYSESGHTIQINAARQNETELLIAVCDEGIGIPPQYRETIFEKFERVNSSDPNSKGLGLGLAFCRLAVEAHGGRIWVTDAPGGGAQFNFTLPLVAAA